MGRDKWGGETVVDDDGIVGVQGGGGEVVGVAVCGSRRIEYHVCGLVVFRVVDLQGGQEVGGGISHGSGFPDLVILSGGPETMG